MTNTAKLQTQAAKYRGRAAKLIKSLKGRNRPDRAKIEKTVKALDDMADNEDWLDGKPGSQLK